MKKLGYTNIVWTAAVICSFAIGYTLSDSLGEKSRLEAASAISKSGPSSNGEPRNGEHNPESANVAGRAAPKATAEQLRAMMFQMESEPKLYRVQRMQRLSELIPYVTKENWREVLAGFDLVMRTRGTGVTERYMIMLEHIGAIAGADALEDSLKPGQAVDDRKVIELLKAWCEVDPKAGIAWYEAQPAEIQKKYMGQFLVGVSRADPKAALEMTFKKGEGYSAGGTMTAVINNAVSILGYQGTEDLFNSMSARTDISANAKAAFFSSTVKSRLQVLANGQNPVGDILAWYETHAGKPYVSQGENERIVTRAAESDPISTLNWLDGTGDRLPAPQASRAYSIAGTQLQKRSPEQLANWITANPTHPGRDDVLAGAAESLVIAKDFNSAIKMAKAIADPEKSKAVAQMVQSRSAN